MPLSGVRDWIVDAHPDDFSCHVGGSQRRVRAAEQDASMWPAPSAPTRAFPSRHGVPTRALHAAFLGVEDGSSPQRVLVDKLHCQPCNYSRLAQLLEEARVKAGTKGLQRIDIEDVMFQPPGAKDLAAVLEKASDSLESLHIRHVVAHQKAARSDRGATQLGGALRHMHKLQELEFSVRGGLCQAGAWAIEVGLPKGRWGRQPVGDGFMWMRQAEEPAPEPSKPVAIEQQHDSLDAGPPLSTAEEQQTWIRQGRMPRAEESGHIGTE
mmetsp:Transcript_40695/g.73198  ORF Transcript_40695/g.73198 Transcript_40695/m.73198 type:complete len:267 (+) Transcript_40695:126-926(+)